MDCELLADIYSRSCLHNHCNSSPLQYQADANCMTVMQIMKRNCYNMTTKEEVVNLLDTRCKKSSSSVSEPNYLFHKQ